jgi:hypothetical protein
MVLHNESLHTSESVDAGQSASMSTLKEEVKHLQYVERAMSAVRKSLVVVPFLLAFDVTQALIVNIRGNISKEEKERFAIEICAHFFLISALPCMELIRKRALSRQELQMLAESGQLPGLLRQLLADNPNKRELLQEIAMHHGVDRDCTELWEQEKC